MPLQKELRVHGVSGTPPRDMLYTDPVPRDPPTEENKYARVFDKPDRDDAFDVQGFHWGGLTAGNWRTVFWILLAPFLLANVAGWMPRRNGPWGVALVRIAGLALTALFVSQAVTVVVLLPTKWLENTLDWQAPTVRKVFGILLFALVAAVFLLLVRAASRSHFDKSTPESRLRRMMVPRTATMLAHPKGAEGKISPDAEWNDPAGTTLTDPAIWGAHAIVYRLRRLHLGIGLTTIAMAAAIWADNVWMLAVGFWVFAVLAFLIGGTSFWPRNRSVLSLTAVSSLVSLLLAIAGLVAIAFSESPGMRSTELHTLTFGITVVLGVAAMASVLSAGVRTVGALVIASQFGAVLGIAAGVILEQLLGVGPILIPNGAGWVAVAMLFLLATLLITALILSALPTERVGRSGFGALLRRIVLRAPVVFRVAGLFGIGFGILALVMSVRASAIKAQSSGLDDLFTLDFARRFFGGFTPKAMGVPVKGGTVELIALAVGILLFVILTVRLAAALTGWKKLIALVVPAGAVGLWYASAAGLLRFSFFGVGFDLQRDLVAIAVVVTVLIPGAFMLSSIIRGVREGEDRRRQVGILWDIGSFWPRWFHPLAPPGYGPAVVDTLVTELKQSDADLLAAHSQGTLITAVAISQMDEAELPGSFITYGSQLGRLYPAMFPAAGVDLVVSEVIRRFDGRWINLWRNDDPIGGQYVEALGTANWQVCSGSGHSGYEVTVEYATARSQVLAGTTVWPPDQARPLCWDAPEP